MIWATWDRSFICWCCWRRQRLTLSKCTLLQYEWWNWETLRTMVSVHWRLQVLQAYLERRTSWRLFCCLRTSDIPPSPYGFLLNIMMIIIHVNVDYPDPSPPSCTQVPGIIVPLVPPFTPLNPSEDVLLHIVGNVCLIKRLLKKWIRHKRTIRL